MGVAGGLSLTAHALVDIAQQLGARVEPFALGPVSAQLGAFSVVYVCLGEVRLCVSEFVFYYQYLQLLY